MNLSPGDTVDVFWDKKERFDLQGEKWTSKKVVEVWDFIPGETLVRLEGHPHCPVRIERVKIVAKNSS